MRGIRSLAALALAALLAAPALPQSVPAAQDQDPGILVTGTRDKPSDWREAETEHVVVLSDGPEKELTRIAHNLERLHFLLSVLLNRVDKPDETVKLRVTLVGDGAEFDAMDLRNLRSREGPYARAFVSGRYYDPREDGPVMAASRYDGKAVLQRGVELSGMMRDLVRMTDPAPAAAPGQQPIEMPGQSAVLSSAYAAQATQFGRSDPLAVGGVNEVAVPITAESRIYAGYAQHYLLTYFPNAYPRWYVDGFGELFATIVSREDGQIEYGRPPEGYSKALNQYMRYPIADVLTGKYLTDKRTTERWTPFHAWALTHMLFFSDDRRGQLHAYLSTIAAGGSPERAAAAFGDLGQLQRDLAAYDNHKVPYERMTYPADRAGEPIVRRLTEGQAAFVKGRLELGARVDIPPASSDPKLAAARAAAIRERDDWLAGLRKDAARYPANLEAQLLLAEAECRSGNGAQCAEAAGRALALAPQNSDALAWKGAGQTQLALAAPAGERAARLKAARATIARANRIDTENPLPLLLYYRSFADAGENAPDVAIEGLAKAVETVPAAPGPRVLLGEALAKRGETVAARRALLPVAMGAYDSPEKARAQALLASLGS